MFIDRHNNDFFKNEAQSFQKMIGGMFEKAGSYLNGQFHRDVQVLIDYFEGHAPINFEVLEEIEGRMTPCLFKLLSFEDLIDHPLFQLFMSCKMGHTKLGGIISFKEICTVENITRQQLHMQTYDLLDNPPEEERKNKLPAIKLHGNSFCFKRDFHHWQATRTRRK